MIGLLFFWRIRILNGSNNKERTPQMFALYYWSRLPDSNWGPSLYKSVALPTELRRQMLFNYLALVKNQKSQYSSDFILSFPQGTELRRQIIHQIYSGRNTITYLKPPRKRRGGFKQVLFFWCFFGHIHTLFHQFFCSIVSLEALSDFSYSVFVLSYTFKKC